MLTKSVSVNNMLRLAVDLNTYYGDFGNNHAAIILLPLESGLREYSVSVQIVKLLKCIYNIE